MRIKRFTVCLGLVVGSLMAGGSGVQAFAAIAPETTTETTTTAVSTPSSPELEAYLATLSPADRATFVNTMLPATVTVTVTKTSATGTAARATGCWNGRVNGSATNAFGGTLYTYYTVGNWCSSNLTITSSRWVEAGGETSTPGWRYDGVINKGAAVTLNQGRSFSQFRFILGAMGTDVQSPTPCLRVKGTNTGGVGRDTVCGNY